MVKEYNFSRSQSGLVIPRELATEADQHFDTNSSINFTNIDLESEIEMLKGSVFNETLEKTFEAPQPSIFAENIESMYANA